MMDYNSMTKEELVKEIERLQFYVRFHSILSHNISDAIHKFNNNDKAVNNFKSTIFVGFKCFVDDCEKQAEGKDINGLEEVIKCLSNI
jgi:hypothetical protein